MPFGTSITQLVFLLISKYMNEIYFNMEFLVSLYFFLTSQYHVFVNDFAYDFTFKVEEYSVKITQVPFAI